MVAKKRAALELADDERLELSAVSRSRTEPHGRVERARIMRRLNTNRPKVERCVDKALSVGAVAALEDLPGRGRKREITEEARAWLVSLACRKPKELGHAQELWTMALLAEHARMHCREEGHPSLSLRRRRCARTRWSTSWSGATPSSTRRWRRCCMSTGR